jgi:hypothetical protein
MVLAVYMKSQLRRMSLHGDYDRTSLHGDPGRPALKAHAHCLRGLLTAVICAAALQGDLCAGGCRAGLAD